MYLLAHLICLTGLVDGIQWARWAAQNPTWPKIKNKTLRYPFGRQLEAEGWYVIIVWKCELWSPPTESIVSPEPQ